MSSINIRFLEELFIKRELRCNKDLYSKYYQRIWPCEESFRAFLHAESSQGQLELAKQIVERLGFMANFPMPHFLFQNLIAAEHQGADQAESGYIAQDHAIHSVNLYILGIYLFFSHEIFHSRLIHYFENKRIPTGSVETPLESSIKSFLTSWRIFCLSHDLGYVLERGVNSDGHLKKESGISPNMLLKYNNFEDELIYEVIARSLARCLYADMIFSHVQKQMVPFTLETLGRIAQWRHWSETGSTPLQENCLNNIKIFAKDYYEIPSINSYMGLKHLLPFIPQEKILTVVKDSNLRMAAICFFHENEKTVYFKEGIPFQPEELFELDHLGSEELPDQGYFCVYFVPKNITIDSKFKNAALSHFPNQLSMVTKQVSEQLGHFISLSANDKKAEENIFEIYKWLNKIMPINNLNLHSKMTPESESFKKQQKQEEIRETFGVLVAQNINSTQFLPNANVSSCIKELSSKLTKLIKDKEFIEKVSKHITRKTSQNPVEAVKTILRTYFRNVIIDVEKTLKPYNNIIQIDDDKVCLSETFQEFNYEIATKLRENSSALGIAFEELMQYQSRYSIFDHGVISSRLVSQSYMLYQSLCEIILKIPVLGCAWPVATNRSEQELTKKDDMLFIEAIFSILLHNVYTSESDSPGISYRQDLSVNPFSYFCAFCDNLQLWDRPKLIDPAYTILPDDRYSGGSFDLTVEGTKVHICCRTNDIRAFLSKKRDSLNTFMRDAPHLIEVTVSE